MLIGQFSHSHTAVDFPSYMPYNDIVMKLPLSIVISGKLVKQWIAYRHSMH